jgi:fructosamine-3-kinase
MVPQDEVLQHEDTFAAEADALAGLREAGYRAPMPQSRGVAAGRAYLLMEFLDLRGRIDFAALGRMLAQAHRGAGPAFGWDRDNYIGATPQANGWSEDWAQFWRERRMKPQLELAKRNGFSLPEVPLQILQGHKPQPSLLHGDLWSGNVSFTPIGPVVFDPAAYYNDREADLAMTELFGGFPPDFYSSYREAYPLDAGYEAQAPVQPVPPAQPPQPVRPQLPRPGGADARPAASPLAAFAARRTGTSRA